MQEEIDNLKTLVEQKHEETRQAMNYVLAEVEMIYNNFMYIKQEFEKIKPKEENAESSVA